MKQRTQTFSPVEPLLLTIPQVSELDFVQFWGKNWAWKLREVR